MIVTIMFRKVYLSNSINSDILCLQTNLLKENPVSIANKPLTIGDVTVSIHTFLPYIFKIFVWSWFQPLQRMKPLRARHRATDQLLDDFANLV